MKPMSPWQFTLFRILFGAYLAAHFLHLAPWAGELFGIHGLLPDPALNPTHGLFPNPLDLPLPEPAPAAITLLLAAAALLFAAGIGRKPAALLLWFGWTALFHRNNLVANPSLPYVGLLLILSLLVPGGEPWSRGPRNESWQMPNWVFRCAWILMATGYTFSGITKLASPSWIDGNAIRYLLDNPLARPGSVRDAMLALPDGLFRFMTWSALSAELSFAPLAFWPRARPWIWLALVAMHIGIIAVVDFADLSLGMLLLHLFTFDPAWRKPRHPLLVRFDGQCLMCSRAIRFIAAEDRADLIRFQTIAGHGTPASMLVESGNLTLDRSAAVLAILHTLGGHWSVLALCGSLLPRILRDRLYDLIAARRYQWFGKADFCSLPDEAVTRRMATAKSPPGPV